MSTSTTSATSATSNEAIHDDTVDHKDEIERFRKMTTEERLSYFSELYYGSDKNVSKLLALLLDVFPKIAAQRCTKEGLCLFEKALQWSRVSHAVIAKLLELYPQVAQHKRKSGGYILHCAVQCRLQYSVKMKLIELFPQAVKTANKQGLYPVHCASPGRLDEKVVLKLLEIFPEAALKKVNQRNDMEPIKYLLHPCVKEKSEVLIRKLLEINPKAVQEKNYDGNYPIHDAVKQNQSIAVSRLLLDSDALALQRQTKNGKSAIHIACRKYPEFSFTCFNVHIDLVTDMIARADSRTINIRDVSRMTPLHYACYCFNIEATEKLLQHPDVDVNATDKSNETPLHKVFAKQRNKDRDDALIYDKYEVPMEPDFDDVILDEDGCPPNYDTTPKTRLQVVRKLFDHPGLVIDSKNRAGKTPLDLFKTNILFLTKTSRKDMKSVMKACSRCPALMEIWQLFEDFPTKDSSDNGTTKGETAQMLG
jgi:ankyrin repeat protein